ncbi:MAG: YjiG family protein [Acidaminococcaceae bacterium]
MSNPSTNEVKPSTNIIELFVTGAYKGVNIAVKNMLPNVMLAFVIIQALKVTGLLDLIGLYAGPLMGLWGLPGEAIAVILASLMSMGGAVGVAAGLLTAGVLSPYDATILLPSMYLMGNPVQNVGRCLGTSGVNPAHYPIIIGICVFNALASIWFMRLILSVL